MCFDLLNSNIYYRLLDIAFGLIEEGFGYYHFAIVLAILCYFEDYLDFIDN